MAKISLWWSSRYSEAPVIPTSGLSEVAAGLWLRDNHGPAKKRISASGARYRPGFADNGVSLANAFSFSDMSAWR